MLNDLLLHGHLVIDLLDAFDSAGHLDRLVDLRLVPDETAQLHFALFGFNHDIAALDVGIRQQRSLYLGRDDAVVDNGSS